MIQYPEEILDADQDEGTMPRNVQIVRDAVVGHRIVSGEHREIKHVYAGRNYPERVFVITLDNGTEVWLKDGGDCCAFTELNAFLLHPERVDHVIMGVGTTKGYTRWHIYADYGDVLELTVGWSGGNLGYYGYGFDIDVVPVDE